MARAARHRIELSEGERVELVRVARAEKRPWQEVQRARIVLYAAEGLHDTEIAARLDTSAGMGVRRWSSFEYRRGGTLAYLAAWDVHHANLFDRVEAKTGIEPFGRLVEHVMTTEPYASARRVFWIVDNGSSHAGRTSIARMPDAWPNARLIHLPIHASQLNQAELFFSIVQRKALTPNDFGSLDELADRLLRFTEHYRQLARPFEWTFTRADLHRVLAEIAGREPHLQLAA